MKEAIKITVVDGETEMELEILNDCDVLEFVDTVTGKTLFSGDWSANFAPVFERALDIWPTNSEN